MRIVQKYLLTKALAVGALMFGLPAVAWADPTVTKIGADLYAYISEIGRAHV